MIVLDASAIVVFLKDEPGTEAVASALEGDCVCSTATWSEVAQKVRSVWDDTATPRSVLAAYGVRFEPVTLADAETAALLWTTMPALSLGDRLCLALTERLDAVALTADRAWGTSERIRQIR